MKPAWGMRVRPWLGGAVGALGVLAIVGTIVAVDPHITRAVPLLLLFVPVTLSGAIGGWRASVPVALGTGLLYSFSFVAPIGAIRIGLTEDVATIVTFVAVALSVSAIGGIRVQHLSERDAQRAVMLRSVSHDLRSPLVTIKAVSSDLRDDVIADPVARARLLDLVVDETDRLDRIVGNMLSLSRIEAGALAPDLHPESLRELIEAAATRLRTAHGIEVHVDVPDHLDPVEVDRIQIDQVLTNLLDNAARHGSGDAPVTIAAAGAGRMVTVTVADSGPGFSAARASAPIAFFNGSGGDSLGVGLAVCKAIVEAHGGTITAGDRATGGARVSFTVPKAR